MKKDNVYKNITTGKFVTILDVYKSENFSTIVIEYRRHIDNEEFVKPQYVFLQTYKQVINRL